MTIYHVETQEDYNALIVELEEKGRKWIGGANPTQLDKFKNYGKDTYIFDESGVLSFSSGYYFKAHRSNDPVIEYKAKGENMTQEEMKQEEMKQKEMKHNIFDWARDVSVAVESFSRDMYEAEADLQEAKSSAKKLIEKIDEYLESQKPKFKVGDYVVELDKYITKITEKNDDDMFKGHFFMPGNNHFSFIKDTVSSYTARHATDEEIAEYEAALIFHKHGRKPFEVKEGDILRDDEGNIVRDDKVKILSANYPKNVRKNYFTSGRYTFLKTVEEVNEWLGADEY